MVRVEHKHADSTLSQQTYSDQIMPYAFAKPLLLFLMSHLVLLMFALYLAG